MKNIVLVFALFFQSFVAISQIDTTSKQFEIKHCKISYEFFNGPQKGIRTVIFDEWGLYKKEIIKAESDTNWFIKNNYPFDLFGPNNRNDLFIFTPTYVYGINLNTKSGGKLNTFDIIASDTSSLLKIESKGKETYLGKVCEVLIIENKEKLWVWKGINVKIELIDKEAVISRECAIEIDENYIPTEKEFEIPDGIVIE